MAEVRVPRRLNMYRTEMIAALNNRIIAEQLEVDAWFSGYAAGREAGFRDGLREQQAEWLHRPDAYEWSPE